VVSPHFGIATCVISIAMDAEQVASTLNLVMAGAACKMLPVQISAFLCAGFVVQPGLRILPQRFRPVRTDTLVEILKPTWHRAKRR